MTPDYPAAHSMDTVWFAVDDDGHVGVFESHADGAVPRFVPELQYEEKYRFLDLLTKDSAEFLWGQIQLNTVGPHLTKQRGPHSYADWYVCFVNANIALESSFSSFVDKPFRVGTISVSGRELAAYAHHGRTTLTLAVIRHIHEENLCQGCAALDESSEELASPLCDVGFFAYVCDGYDLSPYQQHGVPRHPVHISQLPASLQALLADHRLPGYRFAESPLVQPIESTPCHLWHRAGPLDYGDDDDWLWMTYLARDGVTRLPLPMPPDAQSRGLCPICHSHHP